MPALSVSTPLGPVTLHEAGGAITALTWDEAPDGAATPLLRKAARQLEAYFAGDLHQFDLPLAPAGTPAQQRFCAALSRIPYGQTRTYGQMAAELGISAQAAGQLCGRNPIGIIIPCHRVVGRHSLGGFSAPGGVEAKVKLLQLEGADSLLI